MRIPGTPAMHVALLYPYQDLLDGRSGVALRVGLLVDYLAERCEAVTTISPGPRAREVRAGNVRHRTVPPPRAAQRLIRACNAALWLRYRTASRVDTGILCRFAELRLMPSLRRALCAAAREADAVFVEAAFWGAALLPKCARDGVPSILTVHDVLSDTFGRSGPLRAALLRRELGALRLADHAVCVSEEDRDFFREHGVEARCAINPIATDRCVPVAAAERHRRFRSRHGLPDLPVCMFVGGSHFPNLEAVRAIEAIAARTPACAFVIAGQCADPGRSGNVFRLGSISREDLPVLYGLADLVVMPLRTGTGTSLKFVEALAYGKPVLASPVAARGYAVASGEHALVSEDFDGYPRQIAALLADPARRQALSEGARSLSRQYDYRHVYHVYGDLLERIRAERARTVQAR